MRSMRDQHLGKSPTRASTPKYTRPRQLTPLGPAYQPGRLVGDRVIWLPNVSLCELPRGPATPASLSQEEQLHRALFTARSDQRKIHPRACPAATVRLPIPFKLMVSPLHLAELNGTYHPSRNVHYQSDDLPPLGQNIVKLGIPSERVRRTRSNREFRRILCTRLHSRRIPARIGHEASKPRRRPGGSSMRIQSHHSPVVGPTRNELDDDGVLARGSRSLRPIPEAGELIGSVGIDV